MKVQTNMIKNKSLVACKRYLSELPLYPLDMSHFFRGECRNLDSNEVLYDIDAKVYCPTLVTRDALVHWNQYIATNEEMHRHKFLIHARWLVEHEVRIVKDAGGWPIHSFHQGNHRPWLSSLTQGCGISVLVRAYLLTSEEVFLEVARRVVRTFEQDILDGGVSTPIGKGGIFFEEVAAYPATHRLKGFIFGLFGLIDYLKLNADTQIEALICRSLTTLHDLLPEFDAGFWTCSDLLDRHLSSHTELNLHIFLLDALARYSSCDYCSALALRWRGYQQSLGSQLRYRVTSCCNHFGRALWGRARTALFQKQSLRRTYTSLGQDFLRVCVPIPAFPVTGGVRSVLSKIARVTKDIWQLEYLTHYVGPNADGFIIHRFGTRKMSHWQFPAVWLYTLAGFCKLFSLLHSGAGYDMILLQDGIYTAAFGGLVAKMAGIRAVCIDHGNLSLLKSRSYRSECVKAIATKNWSLPRRILARLQYICYWPSLSILARLGAHFVDHYFIPGVRGDGVEETCKDLGVHPSRITRFANMIEVEHHIIPDAILRAEMRKQYDIDADDVVIAIICRLAPEKGLEIALDAISKALSRLSPEMGKRVRVIIAGDGPLREQLEEDIRLRGLGQACLLWGEASSDEVIAILGLSDIFLFTSWRAAGYPMAVLEAMASGCAVIAATDSPANQEMLAEGRGVVLPVGDVERTAKAIVALSSESELCRQMGSLARNYVATQHSAAMLRRALMRAAHWSALQEFLDKSEVAVGSESGS